MTVVNGWELTGNRTERGRWEAAHECGYISHFDSRPQFHKNTKGCRRCNSHPDDMTRAVAYHYAAYKYQAKKRGYEFKLEPWQFNLVVNDVCYYCGDPGTIMFRGFGYCLVGVDRIDNNKGYTFDNVRPCCKDCNFSKGTMSEEEFLNKIRTWHKRLIK